MDKVYCDAIVKQELTRLRDNKLDFDPKNMSAEAQKCIKEYSSKNTPNKTGYAELGQAPKRTKLQEIGSKIKQKALEMKGNNTVEELKEVAENAESLSKDARKVGITLRKTGGKYAETGKVLTKVGKKVSIFTKAVNKVFDAAGIIKRRTLPTVYALGDCWEKKDMLCNGAAYNLGVDIPMTFVEVGKLTTDIIPGTDEYSSELLNKAEEALSNVIASPFENGEDYKKTREEFNSYDGNE